MNTLGLVEYVRTSRGLRQRAEKALLGIEEATDEVDRDRLMLEVVTNQNQAIAALEQALMSAAERP